MKKGTSCCDRLFPRVLPETPPPVKVCKTCGRVWTWEENKDGGDYVNRPTKKR
jgi:hypothetical protein